MRILKNVTKSCVKLIPSFILNMVPSFTDLIYLRLHSKIGDETRILGSNFKLLGDPKKDRMTFRITLLQKKGGICGWLISEEDKRRTLFLGGDFETQFLAYFSMIRLYSLICSFPKALPHDKPTYLPTYLLPTYPHRVGR